MEQTRLTCLTWRHLKHKTCTACPGEALESSTAGGLGLALCAQDGPGRTCRTTHEETASRLASQGWASSLRPWSSFTHCPATRGVPGPPKLTGSSPPAGQARVSGPQGLSAHCSIHPAPLSRATPDPPSGPALTHRDFPPSCPLPCPASPPVSTQLPGASGPPWKPYLPVQAFSKPQW